jgi:PhoPQ-activated pathogenicity-related protein
MKALNEQLEHSVTPTSFRTLFQHFYVRASFQPGSIEENLSSEQEQTKHRFLAPPAVSNSCFTVWGAKHFTPNAL